MLPELEQAEQVFGKLRERLADFESKLAASRRVAEAQEAELLRLRPETKQLKEQLASAASAAARIPELEAAAARARGECEGAAKKAAAAETELRKARADLALAVSRAEKAAAERKAAEEAAAAAGKQSEKLLRETHRLAAELCAFRDEASARENRLKSAIDEHRKLDAQFNQQLAEAQAAAQQAAAAAAERSTRLKTALAERDTLLAGRKSLEHDLAKLREELTAARTAGDAAIRERDGLRKELADARSLLDQLEKRQREAKAQMDAASEDAKKAADQIAAHRASIASLNAELAKEREAKEEALRQVAQLAEKARDLDVKLYKSVTEREGMEAMLSGARANLKSLNEMYQVMADTVERLEGELQGFHGAAGAAGPTGGNGANGKNGSSGHHENEEHPADSPGRQTSPAAAAPARR